MSLYTSDTRKLYVANIPGSWLHRDVRIFFENYGPLKYYELLAKKVNVPEKTAIVTFISAEDGKAALAADGTLVRGARLPLVVRTRKLSSFERRWLTHEISHRSQGGVENKEVGKAKETEGDIENRESKIDTKVHARRRSRSPARRGERSAFRERSRPLRSERSLSPMNRYKPEETQDSTKPASLVIE